MNIFMQSKSEKVALDEQTTVTMITLQIDEELSFVVCRESEVATLFSYDEDVAEFKCSRESDAIVSELLEKLKEWYSKN